MAKLIDVRNDRMHAKGRVHCRTEEEFTKDIKGYLTCMKLVISKQNEFLENIYGGLVVTYEPGYEFKIDDLKVNYAGQYLFSEYELSMLASGKSDVASIFIREYYGES